MTNKSFIIYRIIKISLLVVAFSCSGVLYAQDNASQAASKAKLVKELHCAPDSKSIETALNKIISDSPSSLKLLHSLRNDKATTKANAALATSFRVSQSQLSSPQ